MASALAPDGDQVNEHVEHVEEPPALLAVPRDDLQHRGNEEPPALLAVPRDEVQHRGGEAQAVSKWPATAAKILKVRGKLRSVNRF